MNKKTKKPLYLLVEDRLRDEINAGVFREGELIPKEKDLAKRYGVSQGTVRRAALSLKEKGLLYRVQRKGTSVVFQERNKRRLIHYRFTNQVHSHPDLVNATAVFLNLQVIAASKEIADFFQIRKGSKVIRVERMGHICDGHLFHTVSFFPDNLYKGLDKFTAEQFVKNTVWKIQEIFFGLRIARREEFISIVSADQNLARILDVDPGTSLLRIEALVKAPDEKTIEYRVSHCNSGNLKFYVCQESL
jgi:GntR family transcriptional regulator